MGLSAALMLLPAEVKSPQLLETTPVTGPW